MSHPTSEVTATCARLNKGAAFLGELVQHLSGLVEEIAQDISITPSQVARAFFSIREAHAALDAQVKAVYHLRDRLDKNILPERLDTHGTDMTRVPDLGRSFSITHRLSVSFIDREAGFEWLRGLGQGDLIQETVNAGTLAAFVRNLQINEGVDPPEDVVKLNPYRTISVTKYSPKVLKGVEA